MSRLDSVDIYKSFHDSGWELYSHNGEFTRATLCKEGIDLHLWIKDNQVCGKLSFVWNLLTVSTLDFSLPNKNFPSLSTQISKAYSKLNKEVSAYGQ